MSSSRETKGDSKQTTQTQSPFFTLPPNHVEIQNKLLKDIIKNEKEHETKHPISRLPKEIQILTRSFLQHNDEAILSATSREIFRALHKGKVFRNPEILNNICNTKGIQHIVENSSLTLYRMTDEDIVQYTMEDMLQQVSAPSTTSEKPKENNFADRHLQKIQNKIKDENITVALDLRLLNRLIDGKMNAAILGFTFTYYLNIQEIYSLRAASKYYFKMFYSYRYYWKKDLTDQVTLPPFKYMTPFTVEALGLSTIRDQAILMRLYKRMSQRTNRTNKGLDIVTQDEEKTKNSEKKILYIKYLNRVFSRAPLACSCCYNPIHYNNIPLTAKKVDFETPLLTCSPCEYSSVWTANEVTSTWRIDIKEINSVIPNYSHNDQLYYFASDLAHISEKLNKSRAELPYPIDTEIEITTRWRYKLANLPKNLTRDIQVCDFYQGDDNSLYKRRINISTGEVIQDWKVLSNIEFKPQTTSAVECKTNALPEQIPDFLRDRQASNAFFNKPQKKGHHSKLFFPGITQLVAEIPQHITEIPSTIHRSFGDKSNASASSTNAVESTFNFGATSSTFLFKTKSAESFTAPKTTAYSFGMITDSALAGAAASASSFTFDFNTSSSSQSEPTTFSFGTSTDSVPAGAGASASPFTFDFNTSSSSQSEPTAFSFGTNTDSAPAGAGASASPFTFDFNTSSSSQSEPTAFSFDTSSDASSSEASTSTFSFATASDASSFFAASGSTNTSMNTESSTSSFSFKF